MKRAIPILLTIVFTVSALGQMQHEQMKKPTIVKAVAVLQPMKGKSVRGWVTFETVEQGVRVIAEITGLTPGKHGFHIHEFGDCSSDDGLAAGGHFNPTAMPHSAPMSDKRHVGDLGNIEADMDGKAKLDYVDPMLKLEDETSIVGRAVIVHEKEDDLNTQPTGDAGGRLACGVIGVAKK